MTRNRRQVRADVSVLVSATGTLIVPPSVWYTKCGLRREPNVVDEMKLPAALGFAIGAQIHVSLSQEIESFRFRAVGYVPRAHQNPYDA